MFRDVRALAVYVTNLKKAKEFYTTILGFELYADLGPNLCFLKSKSGKIYIYMESGNRKTFIDNKTCRLSFFLQTEKTASETYAYLKAAGVKLLQQNPQIVADGTACFQFEDLDGNIIEVSGKP